MSTIGERIRQARETAGMSTADLARACNVSYSAVHQWESGATKGGIKPENLARAAKATGVLMDWLATGDGDMRPPITGGLNLTLGGIGLGTAAPSSTAAPAAVEGLRPIRVWETADDLPAGEYVLIPTLRVELAAGNGKKVVSVDYGHPKAFLAEWIRDRRLTPKYLVSMRVTGDSMSPWVNDGDSVVIDRSTTEIRDGKPYAIRYGNELRIKHLHKRFDGGLILRSLNPDFRDEVIAPTDLEHVEILGLVVWRAG